MLRLSLKSEPDWVEVWPGVELLVRPITSAIIAAAKADPEFRDATEVDGLEPFKVHFNRAVAMASVIDWRGVGEADGTPIDQPSREAIGRLMDYHQISEAFWEKCASKAFLLADEKKD